MKETIISIFILFLVLNLFSQTKSESKIINKVIKTEIVSFDVIIDSLYKSNQPIDFEIKIVNNKGKIIQTNGNVNYYLFEIIDSIAYINKSGQLVLNIDKIGLNDTVMLNIRLKHENNISKIISISLNYKGHLYLNFSGKNGTNGKNGENGKIDPNNKAILWNGEKGKDGGSGENGHKISVTLDSKYFSKLNEELLIIYINDSTSQTTKYYYSDLKDFSISINISGGNGGNGGLGGKGGKGDLLSVTDINGSNLAYDGKYGGNGGNGGQGGDCGSINLNFNSKTVKYKTNIQIIANVGLGGKPGPPGERGEPGDLLFRGKTYRAKQFWRQSRSECSECYENPGKAGINGQCTKIY